jgi:hypothetical protein
MKITLQNNKSIGVIEDRNGRLWACNYHPAKALPDDAPQAVKDMAAAHWTPEVIQAAKARLVRAVEPRVVGK